MPSSSHPRLPTWRLGLWGAATLLWLLPAVAMQFSSEIGWDRGDFLVFGAMLLAACAALEVTLRITARRKKRLVAGALIATAFLLVWAELAVGLFD